MLDFAAAAALGSLVAIGELVSRYRDSPRRALWGSGAAWFYCLLNGATAIAALALIVAFGIDFGQKGAALEWTRILTAGVSAIAFFRTSLFTVRVGGQDLGVGPVSFLQVILDAVDRSVDRNRASGRAHELSTLVDGLSFEKAFVALPTYCLALMQNLAPEDQRRLGESVLALRDMSLPENVKLRILAAYLMNAVGPDALQSAIQSLAKDLQADPIPGLKAPSALT